MKINKKVIAYIIIGLILVGAATTATVLVLKSINNGVEKANTVVTEESADDLKSKAVEALNNSDKTKAKTLFLQAQKQYDELNTTESKTVDQIDIEAQLFLLKDI